MAKQDKNQEVTINELLSNPATLAVEEVVLVTSEEVVLVTSEEVVGQAEDTQAIDADLTTVPADPDPLLLDGLTTQDATQEAKDLEDVIGKAADVSVDDSPFVGEQRIPAYWNIADNTDGILTARCGNRVFIGTSKEFKDKFK